MSRCSPSRIPASTNTNRALKEVPISATPLTIPAGGMDYALPTDKPGDYALVIRSGDAGGEPHRIFGDRRGQSVALARTQCRTADQAQQAGLRAGRADRDFAARALRRQRA